MVVLAFLILQEVDGTLLGLLIAPPTEEYPQGEK